MDSKQQFFDVIYNYYGNIIGEKVNSELLKGLCDRITDYYYEQYTRFGKQHPESIKRYSTFQVKDLDHPTTFEIIIKFFKEKTGVYYFDHSKLALNMTSDELTKFEKNRKDFYNMF